MTRDEVISMAREAGFVFIEQRDGSVLPEHSTLIESFAALVAAAEREACAKLTDERIFELVESFGEFKYGDAQGVKRIKFARAIERELLGENKCPI